VLDANLRYVVIDLKKMHKALYETFFNLTLAAKPEKENYLET
jgi:hypothetical protein